jgi:uncharacterized membrane protein
VSDRRAVLIVAAVMAVVVAVGLLALLADVLRVVVGMLILILPGYAIARALLPPGSLDASRRAAVALTSGVGLMVVGGLLLNRMPPGLSGPAWLALIVIVVLVSIRFAVARGHIAPGSWASPRRWLEVARSGHRWLAGQRGSADATRPLSAVGATFAPGSPARTWLGSRAPGIPGVPALTVTLAILLAIAALSLAREGAVQQDRAQEFTEFWAVLGQAGPGEVRLGIASHEPSRTEYSVRVESGGRSFATFDRISLDPGESWETTVTLPVVPGPLSTGAGPLPSGATPAPVLALPMRAILFRAGSATPYREVTLHGPAPS